MLHLTRLLILGLFAFVLVPSLAHSDPAEGPSLSSFEGDAPKKVEGKSAATMTPGEPIPAGGTAVIPPGSTAAWVFPDGSRMITSEKTEITPEKTEGVPGAGIKYGNVRALIQKSSANTKYRFIIRTPGATMGVRGTEFFVDASQADAVEVRTLEGQVDVARSGADLFAGKGVPIPANQMIRAPISGAMPRAMAFNRGQFLNSMSQKMPQMERLNKKLESQRPDASKMPRPTEKLIQSGGNGVAPNATTGTTSADLRKRIQKLPRMKMPKLHRGRKPPPPPPFGGGSAVGPGTGPGSGPGSGPGTGPGSGPGPGPGPGPGIGVGVGPGPGPGPGPGTG